MARIRTIKPEFWTDEKLGPLDPLTRLVALGLISQADDAGRILDSVRLIDGLLFAYDDSTTCRRSLDELSRTGFIRRGVTRSGQRVIQICGWHHQKIDRPNLRATLPEIYEDSTKDRRSLDEGSSNHTNDLRSTIYDLEAVQHSTSEQKSELLQKARAVFGFDGSEGTDTLLAKAFDDPADRDRCLLIAVSALETEGRPWQRKFFRRVLVDVIAEQKGEKPTVTRGAYTAEAMRVLRETVEEP